jgi:hypothetical protein
MFVLPFLLYTYMTQQNFSTLLNTTSISEWTSTFPTWVSPPTLESLKLPSTPDMAPYAFLYFLSGAMFFLGSAFMMCSSNQAPRYAAIDGIATMSDFTKTNVLKYMNQKPNRELVDLIETNGMDPEEFLMILGGTRKRTRYSSPST